MNMEDMQKTIVLRKRLSEEQIRVEKKLLGYVVRVVCGISIGLAVAFSVVHLFR
jgi:hypothetical protein